MENLEIRNFFLNKRVLVTGATGFIGSHLTRKLTEFGARVNIITKDNNFWRIKDVIHRIQIWKVDITDFQAIDECINSINPQIIFHLAAIRTTQRDIDLIDMFIDINLKGVVNILRAVIKHKINLDIFVNTGSGEEYGNNSTPFVEGYREDPVSPYSASKTAAVYFCQMFYKTFGVPTVTLRPFLTYGPAQDIDMFIPSLIIHCLEKKDFPMTIGEQTREFNYVDDVVDAYISAAVMSDSVKGEVINIGNGIEYKIRDVAEKIVSLIGNPIKLRVGEIPLRKNEIMRYSCDNTKAKRLLNWCPKITLDEGLKRTISWYKQYYKTIP